MNKDIREKVTEKTKALITSTAAAQRSHSKGLFSLEVRLKARITMAAEQKIQPLKIAQILSDVIFICTFRILTFTFNRKKV